jgi:hypothetical protein
MIECQKSQGQKMKNTHGNGHELCPRPACLKQAFFIAAISITAYTQTLYINLQDWRTWD